MVQREIFMGSTILTLVIIPSEDILTRQVDPFVRGTYIAIQANNRGHRKTLRNGVELVPVGSPDHFAFIKVHQNKGTLNGAHHQWAEILIQHENPIIHGMKYSWNPRF